MKRILTLSFVLVLFVAGPLAADCHRQRVIVQHHAAVVNHHVAAVVAPVYVAQYVPVQVPTYSVGYAAPQQQQDTSLALAVEKLSLAVERLSKGGAQTQADSLDAKAAGVLAARCASCHTGAASKGKLAIFTAPGQLAPTVDRFLLWEAADSGRMPKGGQPIPDDEARVLREWVAQAAQQRRAQTTK